MSLALLEKYFELSEDQKAQFTKLAELISAKNREVNLISRKDQEHIWERHILHSLAIGNLLGKDLKNARFLDVGTGGGFPVFATSHIVPRMHLFAHRFYPKESTSCSRVHSRNWFEKR